MTAVANDCIGFMVIGTRDESRSSRSLMNFSDEVCDEKICEQVWVGKSWKIGHFG